VLCTPQGRDPAPRLHRVPRGLGRLCERCVRGVDVLGHEGQAPDEGRALGALGLPSGRRRWGDELDDAVPGPVEDLHAQPTAHT